MQLDPKVTRVAIPSKGRLQEPAEKLLQAAGIRFRRRDRSLFAHVNGLDLVVLLVRPDDIPVLVAEGAADLGIVGQDLVEEHGCVRRVEHLLDLDFGHCRLCVAARERSGIKAVKHLAGKKVAASMVHSARAFFKRHKVKADLVEVSGSVEVMVALGLADAIVDLVESGDTLRDNGLAVIDTVSRSQAVLIRSRRPRDAKLCDLIQRRLKGVLTARQYTLLEYNVRRDRLKAAEKITPGFESPTVSDLEDPKWCAVKVMIPKKQSVEIIDKLEALGASAILETEILNCRL
ncbi:MAG: ATP phosphoribosyltransferase [Planctomycetota bacterium]|nr:ATP phosphoribosyltransferase [Planctomycetota bacterium]